MKKICYLAISLLVISCSTNAPRVDDDRFKRALSSLEKGDKETAKSLLIENCKEGLLVACYSLGRTPNENTINRISVMQGATTQTQTRINVVYPTKKKLNFILWSERGIHSNKDISIREVSKAFSDWKVIKLHIQNLSRNSKYHLIMFNEASEIVDFRKFSTLTTKGKQLKFVVASCLSDSFEKEQRKMWGQIFKDSMPEVIFNIGDTVYADWIGDHGLKDGATPEILWRRYRETWNKLDIYKKEKLIPVYGLWDDHDFGLNNGGKGFKYKQAALETFKAFHAQESQPNIIKGHGVGYALKLRSQMFYFLDNRYFRDTKNNKEGSHFGKEQEQWLYRLLRTYKVPSWIIAGDQFFGAYHPFESYEGYHTKSFDQFLKQIEKTGRAVTFVSGDRHLSEIMKIEKEQLSYETYELTSSGIHTKVYAGSFARDPSPRGIEGVDGKMNYMLINSNAIKANELYMEVESLGLDNTILFSRKLNVKAN